MKRGSIYSKSIFAKKNHLSLNNFRTNTPSTFASSMRSFSSQNFTRNNNRYRNMLPVVLGTSLGCGIAYQADQVHADDSADTKIPEQLKVNDKDSPPLTYELFRHSSNKKLLIKSIINATPTADILHKDPSIFTFINDYLLSNNIYERDPSLINHLNSVLSQYFHQFSMKEKIDKTSKGRLDILFYRLMQTEEDKERLVSIAKENIYLTSEITILAQLLYDNLSSKNKDINLIDEVGQSILDNYAAIEKTEFGLILAGICLENNTLLQERFIKIIEQSITHVSPFTIALASKYSPCNPIIKNYLEQQSEQNKDKVVQSMKTLAYVDHCKEECSLLEKIPKTRTLQHLQKEIKNIYPENPFFRTKLVLPPTLIPHYLFHQWQHHFSLYDSSIGQMVENIINKEIELKSDYYTFFHGQRKSYLPYIQLHTFLQKIFNEHNNNQHLLLHIAEHPNQENIKNEKKLRNSLLNKGASYYEDYSRLLFTNWAFFANASSCFFGSSSAHYVTHNTNAGDPIILTAEKVFITNNIHYLFQKYKNKIEKLIQDFEEITQYGTCMLLAIPKKSIHKHIYLGTSGAKKTKINIEGIGETDDIAIIMKTLETTPEKIKNTDAMEFCIPMTYDKKGALNPESGIKIFALTAANPSALDVWYTQMHNLFGEIAADINSKNQS